MLAVAAELSGYAGNCAAFWTVKQLLVGTRSCAIRHRTSERGDHLVKLMGRSLSSDNERARSQKQQKEASRPCSAGRAGAHPYQRRRSGSFLSFLRCIPTIHL